MLCFAGANACHFRPRFRNPAGYMCLNNRITGFQMTENKRNLIHDNRSVLILFFEFDKNDQLLPVCRTRWSDSITIKKERNEYS